MNITGNTVLITGGGSGIGRALAEALQARGNTVIITGRREAALRDTVAAIPGMAFAVLDITDAGAIRAFAAKVTEDFPTLNVVINNAGVMVAENFLAESYDIDVAETTVATNLLGPIHLTTALLPHLCAQSAATVMTVSSGLAFVPMAATPTYSATKAAIHSWTQSLRHQLAKTSVEVLELAPPAVATDLMPGQAQNPIAMPLSEFTAEIIALIERAETPGGEILVERVKPLRFAEVNGYGLVYGMVNRER